MKTARMLVILVLALVVGLPACVANADFTFGTPTNLGPTVNSSSDDGGTSISADGLTLFFASDRPGGYGSFDLWVATRGTTEDDWGEPTNIGPTVNSSAGEGGPSISADGLSLFFSDVLWALSLPPRPGGYGDGDLWVTTRETINDDWGPPVNLGPPVNTSAFEGGTSISANGLELYFTSNRAGGSGAWDLWVTTRATIDDPWVTPVNLGPTVNSSADELCPSISSDGLALYFHSDRPGGYGERDLWVTTREITNEDWGTPMNLGSTVNSSANEIMTDISADGRTLFFNVLNRPGGVGSWDICQAPVIPIVDFNGDGIVDSADMCMMIDHWGEDYSLCDIGPMPWGDGIVDVQDLIVLAEHLFEEFPPVE